MARLPVRQRNDPRQYDDLADEWWDASGEFAALHWIAAARAQLIPPPSGAARLLDVGCGGGVLADQLPGGYRHVGIDVTSSALRQARRHGVEVVQADAARLPFADATFEVVVAGEIFEHVRDVEAAVAEACRVLRPGGTVVVDTIAATRWARFSLVTVGERLPGGPPRRCHDPALFVDPGRLQTLFAAHGVTLEVAGLDVHPLQYLRFLALRRGSVRMRRTKSLAGVYQGWGTKRVPERHRSDPIAAEASP